MTVDKRKNESTKDERARAVENNPCALCKSLGLPICRGHGGGSGGGSEDTDNSDEKIKNNYTQLFSPQNSSAPMDEILVHSDLWHLPADADFIFEFDDPYALLNITLNMELGLLIFQSKKELSSEELEAVGKLFDQIEKQFSQFKKSLDNPQIPLESMTLLRTGNTLTLKIPNPKYYDTFVQQLMDKNLLPSKAVPLQQQHKTESKELSQEEATIQRYTSLLPNPFDIKNGPRFSSSG